MAKFGKIERPAQPDQSGGDNPYVMVSVKIGGVEVLARPFEFDSEPVDNATINKDGKQIKPTAYSTSCPNCGHGVTLYVSGDYISGSCENCKAATDFIAPDDVEAADPDVRIYEDPFCNPVLAGRITMKELDESFDDIEDISQLISSSDQASSLESLDDTLGLGDEEEVSD